MLDFEETCEGCGLRIRVTTYFPDTWRDDYVVVTEAQASFGGWEVLTEEGCLTRFGARRIVKGIKKYSEKLNRNCSPLKERE